MTRLPKNVSYTNLEQEQTDEDDVVPSNDFAGSTNMLPLSGDGSGIPFEPSHFFPGPRTTIRSNLVSCTIYSCIVWIGLLIIWYMYTRHQSSDTMLPRILAPLAIVVHTYVVSRGMYWLLAQSPMLRHRQWLRGGYNYYRKESNDEFVDIVTEENNRTAVKSSDWMPIPTSDDNAGTLTKSSSVEMGLVHDIRVESPLWNGPDDRSLESNGRGVEVDTSSDVIEMSIGRPTVHQILRQFDKNCHRPGLYVCGTSTLMQDIRNAVNERSSRHCRRNRPSYIALYEETFEI